MGNVVEKFAFLPPPPSYHQIPELFFTTSTIGDTIPYVFFNRGSSLTIVFSHANAEDLGSVIPWIRHLAETFQVNTAAYEYPGYGLSTGICNEESTLFAAEACMKDLKSRHQVRPDRCVVWGRSLGTGPSVHLAGVFPVRGLILQSAFSSVLRVPMSINNSVVAPFDKFDNIHKITKVDCPVFVIHGTLDEICPVAHGLQLYASCRNPWKAWIIPLASHNNIEMEHTNELLQHVKSFLNHVETAYCPPSGRMSLELNELDKLALYGSTRN
eukprot:c7740_g1_i2.p1 GENE.c7740_g1_i2~~c7740_g1_i2.p1  ORF type:complete len:285 (+),score=85.76 c7740_g1_i2:47-856(+)